MEKNNSQVISFDKAVWAIDERSNWFIREIFVLSSHESTG